MNPAAELLLSYRCVALLYVLFAIQQNSMLLKSNIICKSRCKHLAIQHLGSSHSLLTIHHSLSSFHQKYNLKLILIKGCQPLKGWQPLLPRKPPTQTPPYPV